METGKQSDLNASEAISFLERLRNFFAEINKVFLSIPRAFNLVWDAGRLVTLGMFALTGVSAFLPASIAWITKLVVDTIVSLASAGSAQPDLSRLYVLLAVLGGVWILQKTIGVLNGVLTRLLQFRVEQHTAILIMRKCCDFDIAYFENPKNLVLVQKSSKD